MLRKQNYKDLNKWRTTKRMQKRRYYSKSQDAINKNNRWNQEEIDMIIEHTMTDRELSKLIGRSMAAIQAQRNRSKKKLAKKG